MLLTREVVMVRIAVGQITTSDGTEITTPTDALTIFVGPNSAGKSRALKDIRTSSRAKDTQGIAVTLPWDSRLRKLATGFQIA